MTSLLLWISSCEKLRTGKSMEASQEQEMEFSGCLVRIIRSEHRSSSVMSKKPIRNHWQEQIYIRIYFLVSKYAWRRPYEFCSVWIDIKRISLSSNRLLIHFSTSHIDVFLNTAVLTRRESENKAQCRSSSWKEDFHLYWCWIWASSS